MKDQVVIITGGGTGFGRAMAYKFVAAGCKVLITGRREEPLRNTMREVQAMRMEGSMEWIQADMTSSKDAHTVVDRAVELWGKIDVLINNAGGGVRITPFDDYSEEEIQHIINLNLMTAIHGCHAAIPLMKNQQSGVIINVLSVCAKHAWPSWSVYTAAKMGLLGLTRCLYGELRPFGVRVGSLIPGSSKTEFATSMNVLDQDGDDRLQPEDVAESAYLMASLPSRAFIEELIVWGIDQEVIPR